MSGVCRKHSRAALLALEETLLSDVVEPQLRKLAEGLGFSSVQELLDYFEEHPEELTFERLQEAARRARVAGIALGALAGWVAKRGGLRYEEVLELARECGLERLYKFARAYPNITRALLDFLNRLAELSKRRAEKRGA
jgi:DNA-binding transcriptional ArsR family regulator